eukprot:m.24165 g.24165  ORF g.24165 m.24165 type:complete len:239 (-) comp8563_c1_seq1:120-836(-)
MATSPRVTSTPSTPSTPRRSVSAVVVEKLVQKQVFVLPSSSNLRAITTSLRSRETSLSEYRVQVKRLSRLVVEKGVSLLPTKRVLVTTPSGHEFEGVELKDEPCGMCVLRGGQAMQEGLRQCLPNVRMGHVVIQYTTADELQVYYSHLPSDITHAPVLLLHPVIETGRTLMEALAIVLQGGAREGSVIILALYASRSGLEQILAAHPKVRIVVATTAENCTSLQFTERYFGCRYSEAT